MAERCGDSEEGSSSGSREYTVVLTSLRELASFLSPQVSVLAALRLLAFVTLVYLVLLVLQYLVS